MSTGQAIVIAVGFVAAVFAIGMGWAQAVEWLRARRGAKGDQRG